MKNHIEAQAELHELVRKEGGEVIRLDCADANNRESAANAEKALDDGLEWSYGSKLYRVLRILTFADDPLVLVAARAMQLSGFPTTTMTPERKEQLRREGKLLEGPVQVYEDSPFWNAQRGD